MDNELLIELVKERTCLYDITDKKYSDTNKKDAAWKQIALLMNTTEIRCKKTWNALRDAFRRAHRRQKRARLEKEDVVTKKWKYEDEMAFLIPYLKERNLVASYHVEEEMYDESSSEADKSMMDTEAIHNALSLELVTPDKPRDKLKRSYPSLEKAESPETSDNQRDSDDIDSLFSSLAATVKMFPPRQRAIAKAQVFAVISSLEMEYLNQLSDIK